VIYIHGTVIYIHGTVIYIHGTVIYIHGTVIYIHGDKHTRQILLSISVSFIPGVLGILDTDTLRMRI
jgi:hypothetical protein